MEKSIGNPQTKPEGGFVFITVVQLFMIWWAYRRSMIRLIDLRTWFACQEIVAKRCKLGKHQRPDFKLAEIHRLVGGVGGEHIRNSIRRLEVHGLLSWSESAITFPAGFEKLQKEAWDGFRVRLEQIENHKRKVPVPRRIIRFLAGGCRRGVIATVIGHLLRCMYYRGGQCKAVGACKASWIASMFSVDERNVKGARKHLIELRWLLPVESPQWHKNRWGKRVEINLAWSGRVELSTNKTPPHASVSTSKTPPLESNRKLLSEYKNQKPAAGRPVGFCCEEGKERSNAPTLSRVVPADLKDTGRLFELFRQAAARGFIGGSDNDQLQFVAAAIHASVIGSRNPCGLFASLIRRRLWHFATQADEDLAQERIRRHLHGTENRQHGHSQDVCRDFVSGILKEWATRKSLQEIRQ